jgi:hypothetical protein
MPKIDGNLRQARGAPASFGRPAVVFGRCCRAGVAEELLTSVLDDGQARVQATRMATWDIRPAAPVNRVRQGT